MLVQKGVLTESQMRKIIDIIDIKKLVNHNKLSPEFIENILRQIVENDFNSDDSDDLTMYDIYIYKMIYYYIMNNTYKNKYLKYKKKFNF
jgi:hypothetical protein